MALWLFLSSAQRASFFMLSSENFKEIWDSPKESMKDKDVKPWAEAIKKKKESMIVKDSTLWSCVLWSGFIEQRQSDGKVGTADKSRCKLGWGALVTLSTPQRPDTEDCISTSSTGVSVFSASHPVYLKLHPETRLHRFQCGEVEDRGTAK